jgi:hypothetical protein
MTTPMGKTIGEKSISPTMTLLSIARANNVLVDGQLSIQYFFNDNMTSDTANSHVVRYS